jgi:hypothetical protein
MERKERVLVIGTFNSQDSKAVDSYRWWSDLPNLSDYKTIILDPTRILNDYLYSQRITLSSGYKYLFSKTDDQDWKIQSNLRLVKRKLLEMLQFDEKIYVLYTRPITIDYIVNVQDNNSEVPKSYKKAVELINTGDWSPISIQTNSEIGKTIKVKDDSYQSYFKEFKQWDYYFIPDSIDSTQIENYYSRKWKVTIEQKIIASSNIENSLATEFITCFHNWIENEETTSWESQPSFIGAKLVYLPIIDSYSPKPHIDSLLVKIGILEKTPPPVWVNRIVVPGQESLLSEIQIKKQQLESLNSVISQQEELLVEKTNCKKILFETGLDLQDHVKLCFEEMGIITKPSVVTDEFMIVINGIESLVEVKGNIKSITKDDIAQLVVDLGVHLKTTHQDVKGLLIGNGWRLEPLELRDAADKPIFSRDAIRVAESQYWFTFNDRIIQSILPNTGRPKS